MVGYKLKEYKFGEIVVDPKSFEYEELTLDEFLKKLKETPTLIFNPFQRLYAALTMFGDEDRKGKIRYRFLDDPVEHRVYGKEAGEDALYGVEEQVEKVMGYLRLACVDKRSQGRVILFYGPPSTGKTKIIKLIENTLDGFMITKEGAIYTVKFDIGDLKNDLIKYLQEKVDKEFEKYIKDNDKRVSRDEKINLERKLDEYKQSIEDKFKNITELLSPARINPISVIWNIDYEKAKKVISELEEKMSGWMKPNPNFMLDPASNYIISALVELGDKDIWKRIKVVRQYPSTDIKAFEIRPKDEKSYDPTFFGGKRNMNMWAKFLDELHPLVLEYGIGGSYTGPSCQWHIVHFSEMYKNEPAFFNQILDIIQNRTLSIADKYIVPLNVVFIGTTNLGEFEEKSKDPKLERYLLSRLEPVGFENLLVKDDMAEALSKKVFVKDKFLFSNIHIPPHFVEEFLASMAVLAALEDPESELKLTKLQKMFLYNNELPPGKESEYDWKREKEEVWKKHNLKPPLERIEGIKLGIPFRFFENNPAEISNYLKRLLREVKDIKLDERYSEGCISLLDIVEFYKELVMKESSLPEETRNDLLENIIDITYNLWEEKIKEDVLIAATEGAPLNTYALRYIAMIWAEEKGEKKYRDPLTNALLDIDDEFIKNVEEYLDIANPRDFRKDLARNIKLRLKDYGGNLKEFAEILLEENKSFYKAIRNYVLKKALPPGTIEIDPINHEANKEIIEKLKKMGYCDICALVAIRVANKDGEDKKGENNLF